MNPCSEPTDGHQRGAKPKRFVVLQHSQPASQISAQRRQFLSGDSSEQPNTIDVHFDLMLESDCGLLTWAMPAPPTHGLQCPAIRLPPHRRAYLDYEGPVSKNRGDVRRVLNGTYSGDPNPAASTGQSNTQPTHITLVCHATASTIHLQITSIGGDQFQLHFTAD